YEWAVVLNRICLQVFGIWPDNNDIKQRSLMLDIRVIFILIIIICSSVIPTIHSLIRIWGDFMSTIDNLQYTLPLVMSILKLFIMWQKKEEIAPVLKMVKEDWLKFKTEDERNIMIRRARIARIITICGYVVMFGSFIFAVVLPFFGISLRHMTNITDPGKLMPLQSYYIYDINNSPIYEITYFIQGISLMLAATVYSSTDNFLGLLVLHVCGQLENLRKRFLLLDQDDFKNSLSYNVHDHRRLIKSIKIIDDTFTIMLLGLMIYFGLLFALYGFLFVTIIVQRYGLSFPRLAFIVLAFTSTFAHTCLYCIIGEILVIQCNEFYKAACEYKWYELQPKQVQSLLIIMVHANRPLYLTAGKLFPMTMSTFCNMLKTSGGYISFLLAHRE
ncbi:hypothetical protein X777_01925, partial [Ooceraea biroi]